MADFMGDPPGEKRDFGICGSRIPLWLCPIHQVAHREMAPNFMTVFHCPKRAKGNTKSLHTLGANAGQGSRQATTAKLGV